MAAILALLGRLLEILLEVLSGVQSIRYIVDQFKGSAANVAVETFPYEIQTDLLTALAAINDPTSGLLALRSAIDGIQPYPSGNTIHDVLDAIAGIPTPPTPPDVPAIVAGVWSEVDANSGQLYLNYGQLLNHAGMLARTTIYELTMLPSGVQHFRVQFPNHQPFNPYQLFWKPVPDWSDIRAGDTRLSWLTRTETRFAWSYAFANATVWGVYNGYNPDGAYWTFDLSEQEFQQIASLTPRSGEPIWPGISNVTLGTPVPISATFSTWDECDGVLVVIDTWPPAYGTYDWGSDVQHPRAGYLTFRTDNNDLTEVRAFTFTGECIMVKGMVRATGFLGRAKSGVEGTVTPFTINAP